MGFRVGVRVRLRERSEISPKSVPAPSDVSGASWRPSTLPSFPATARLITLTCPAAMK